MDRIISIQYIYIYIYNQTHLQSIHVHDVITLAA